MTKLQLLSEGPSCMIYTLHQLQQTQCHGRDYGLWKYGVFWIRSEVCLLAYPRAGS